MFFKLIFIVFLGIFTNVLHSKNVFMTPEGNGNKNGTNWGNAADSTQLFFYTQSLSQYDILYLKKGIYHLEGKNIYDSVLQINCSLLGNFEGNDSSLSSKVALDSLQTIIKSSSIHKSIIIGKNIGSGISFSKIENIIFENIFIETHCFMKNCIIRDFDQMNQLYCFFSYNTSLENISFINNKGVAFFIRTQSEQLKCINNKSFVLIIEESNFCNTLLKNNIGWYQNVLLQGNCLLKNFLLDGNSCISSPLKIKKTDIDFLKNVSIYFFNVNIKNQKAQFHYLFENENCFLFIYDNPIKNLEKRCKTAPNAETTIYTISNSTQIKSTEK